jgi:hypothetical protein
MPAAEHQQGNIVMGIEGESLFDIFLDAARQLDLVLHCGILRLGAQGNGQPFVPLVPPRVNGDGLLGKFLGMAQVSRLFPPIPACPAKLILNACLLPQGRRSLRTPLPEPIRLLRRSSS